MAEQTFGELIRARRKALGLTQAKLAELIGCRQAEISAYETSGRLSWSPSRLRALAKALHIRCGELSRLVEG